VVFSESNKNNCHAFTQDGLEVGKVCVKGKERESFLFITK
jgi:hypothetical protein